MVEATKRKSCLIYFEEVFNIQEKNGGIRSKQNIFLAKTQFFE
jgi:hypothetical protein